MSLTAPSEWKYASKNASSGETWLIQLGYGTSTAYRGISDRDIIMDTVQYYGVVQDFGQITEKIDLAKSKAAIGNIQITCVNKYASGKLTDLFFTGTDSTEFLNRDVKIYSRMGDTTAIADCVEIYRGRLTKVDFDSHYVTLYVEQSYPWWNVSIPQVKSLSGKYAPVAYGNFVEVATSGDGQINTSQYPCPFERRDGTVMKYITAKSHSGDAELHYYDKNLDGFHKIASAVTNTVTDGNVNVATFLESMQQSYFWYPVSVYTGDTFTNSANRIKGGAGAATATDTLVATDTSTFYLRLNIPAPDVGVFTTLSLDANCSVTLSGITGYSGADDAVVRLEENTFGSAETIVERYFLVSGAGTTADTGYSRNLLTLYQSAGYSIPEYIELKASFIAAADGGSSITMTATVNDVYLSGTITLSDGSQYDWIKRSEALKDVTEAYCGGDGFAKGYTSGSGTAQLAHEIHRDIIDRFVGLDDTDGASSVGWSSLNTDRAAWNCLYWIKKPRPIQDILEELQYEGCFIFTLEADGGFKYIHVESSYDSSDVVYTLDENDFSDFPMVGTTNLSDIVTEQVFNYKRHPARDDYIETATFTNTSSRSAYWKSILTEENSITINLNALASDSQITGTSTVNASIGAYYDNIYGEPKILISGTLVNSGVFNLQIGDIVKYSLDYDPFAKSWSNLYFMVIETKRKLGSMDIVAREVFAS